eukprot:942077_1
MRIGLATPVIIAPMLGKHTGVSAETVRGKVPTRELTPLTLVGEPGPFSPLDDTCRWVRSFLGTGIDMVLSSNNMQVTVARNARQGFPFPHFSAQARSKAKITGDFDVQVDFDLDQYPGMNGVRIGLFAISDIDNKAVTVGFSDSWEFPDPTTPDDDNKFVVAAGIVDGAGGDEFTVYSSSITFFDADPQTLSGGSLRLIREGSMIQGVVFNDGDWVNVGLPFNNVGVDDVSFALRVWGNDFTFQWMYDEFSTDTVVDVSLNNFQVNSGTIIPFQAPGCGLGPCEGDCDNDADCQPHLRCFKREPNTVDVVPGCYGNEYEDPGKDYCTVRDLWLLKVGDKGIREDNGLEMSVDPLGLCEGDCNSNSDCKGYLVCFERYGTEYVPGCWNVGGDPKEDYCVDPYYYYHYYYH